MRAHNPVVLVWVEVPHNQAPRLDISHGDFHSNFFKYYFFEYDVYDES